MTLSLTLSTLGNLLPTFCSVTGNHFLAVTVTSGNGLAVCPSNRQRSVHESSRPSLNLLKHLIRTYPAHVGFPYIRFVHNYSLTNEKLE